KFRLEDRLLHLLSRTPQAPCTLSQKSSRAAPGWDGSALKEPFRLAPNAPRARWSRGSLLSGAAQPVCQQRAEVGLTDRAVAIDVAHAARPAASPVGQQQAQVFLRDLAVAVEVADAARAAADDLVDHKVVDAGFRHRGQRPTADVARREAHLHSG